MSSTEEEKKQKFDPSKGVSVVMMKRYSSTVPKGNNLAPERRILNMKVTRGMSAKNSRQDY